MKSPLYLDDVADSLAAIQRHLTKAEAILDAMPREPRTIEHASQLLILHELLVSMKDPVKTAIGAVEDVSSRFACDLMQRDETTTTLKDFEEAPAEEPLSEVPQDESLAEGSG
jgi:hypothetical protein